MLPSKLKNHVLNQALITTAIPHPLVARLKLKQQLLETNNAEHQAIRSVAVFDGGGMRGAYGGGVITALEQLDMNDVFDDLVGISSGACTAAYLAAKQAKLGASIFYEDLPKNGFINYRHPRKLLDMDVLAQAFREFKPLDQVAIRKSRSRLHFGMTSIKTGEGIYLGLENMPQDFDIIQALVASSSVPGLTKFPAAAINGRLYSDGLSACVDPLSYAIDTLGATDVLIVMNHPLDEGTKLTKLEIRLNRLLLRNFPSEFITAHESRHQNNGLVANRVYPSNVTVGIFCPSETPVTRTSSNANKLLTLTNRATSQVINAFNQ
jgi:predicted patatin/cPLA2 family phospholipase